MACSESELATKAADTLAMSSDDLAGAREGVVFRSVSALGLSRLALDVAFPSRIGRVVALSQIVQRGAN